ncbi:MAG: thioredoxin family protein [Nanoarchaeota archaeon]|nr:thioredoxin family protein [Nanoarchaeota archaeon]
MNKKRILLIMIVLLVIGAIYYLENSTIVPPRVQTQPLEQAPLKDGKYPLAPELAGITGYLNTNEDLKIADLRGKVIVIDFWTYTCINCIRTLPHLIAWDEKYRDEGLVIIGVHTPEFEFEKMTENVQNAIEKYGIRYPVVQDNNYATWAAYENRYWPHKYLIDSEGYVRYHHIGEGGYAETEMQIQELLKEIDGIDDAGLTTVEDKTPTAAMTPELYAGYSFALPRGQNIGNDGWLRLGETVDYSFSELNHDHIYLRGLWKSNTDDLEAQGDSSIFLGFTAKSVNIVAEGEEPVEMDVRLDGKYITPDQAGSDVQFAGERAFVIVDEPRLYNIVDGGYGTYVLDLRVQKGFRFNAFTFG